MEDKRLGPRSTKLLNRKIPECVVCVCVCVCVCVFDLVLDCIAAQLHVCCVCVFLSVRLSICLFACLFLFVVCFLCVVLCSGEVTVWLKLMCQEKNKEGVS